jgi:hypothetical protein
VSGEAAAIRPAADYQPGERIVLTLPLRTAHGLIPAGAEGKVVERSTEGKQDWLRVTFTGYEDVADSLRTVAFKVASLEGEEGRPFLPAKNHGEIPLRQAFGGWCLPDGEIPIVRAQLADGRVLTGAVPVRTPVGGSPNIASTFQIATKRWSESGEGIWEGPEVAAEEIVRLTWLSQEKPADAPSADLLREPWQRFAKYVKIAQGLHDTAIRDNMQFQFCFKNKDDADRVLGTLTSELLVALRRGDCWFRGNNQQGKYQLAWKKVQLSMAQGKDLLNRVSLAGGEIFEAIVG